MPIITPDLTAYKQPSKDTHVTVLAIDPGSRKSGWCVWDGYSVIDRGTCSNAEMRVHIGANIWCAPYLALERIVSYGPDFPVGEDIHETVFWAGMFAEVALRLGYKAILRIPRKTVMASISCRATDGDQAVRRAVQPFLNLRPGEMMPIKNNHERSALAVGICAESAVRTGSASLYEFRVQK